jgi:ribonuclease BN (tRNA processing enzyme)
MQVVLLGTGTPNAEPDRSGPAVAVVVDETPYLVDFGPGVVRQASAARQRGVAGLAVEKLSRAFLTHLHSDHTAGYPDLIFTPWVLERVEPLQVYGPPGLRSMTEHILVAYKEDVRERIEGREPANERGHRVVPTEIKAGVVYEDARVRVDAFRANHGSWPAFCFRFTAGDQSVVISGDTAPHKGMVEAYAECDILVHEVYSADRFQTLPGEWQRYHSRVHTSTRELATVAEKAQPGLLVLYHQLMWGASEESLVREVQERYDGDVVSGKDFDTFALPVNRSG